MSLTNRYEYIQAFFSLLDPKCKNNPLLLMSSRTERLILSYFSLPHKKIPILNIKYFNKLSQVEWTHAFSNFDSIFSKC